MRRVRLWFGGLVVFGLIVLGLWLWWTFDLRWRPTTVRKDQAKIAAILQGAGWVSPKQPGAKLYILEYHGCPGCDRLESEVLAKLDGKGVDTRVIDVARADLNGQVRSTPADRSTVAELWLNRDWKLYQRWIAAPTWTAAGIPAADGDIARTAVVAAGRQAIDTLAPLLEENGVKFDYPVLIWWDSKGAMRAVAGDKPPSWGDAGRELER